MTADKVNHVVIKWGQLVHYDRVRELSMHREWMGPVGQGEGLGKWLRVGLKTGGVTMRA